MDFMIFSGLVFHNKDILYGGEGDDTLLGLGGDDILEGGAGHDKLDGGAGSDTASYAGSGAGVTVDLSATPDAAGYVPGTGGHAEGDRLKGIENLQGSPYADTLTGDGTANVLKGGGIDELRGNAGIDTLYGGDDVDYLYGNDGNDIMNGGDGNDRLYGHADKDTLNGDGGDDTLFGSTGRDTLDGGAGKDTLYGNEDADTFVFRQDSVVPNPTTEEERKARDAEIDTVMDFSQTQGDRLDFRGLKEHSLFRGGERLSFLATEGAAFTNVKGQVRYEQNEDKDETYVQVDLDGNGAADFQVTLDDSLTLTNADLLLA